MHARQRDRHERVSERADADAARLDLALAPRDAQVPGRAAERDDPLTPLVPIAAPEEDAGRTDLEPAERTELHLHGALDAASPHGLIGAFGSVHADGL